MTESLEEPKEQPPAQARNRSPETAGKPPRLAARGFTPAEKWLHCNGFPALVPGFVSPRRLAARLGPVLLAAFAWAVVIFCSIVLTVVGNAIVATSGTSSDLAATAAMEQIINDSVLATHASLLGALSILTGLLCAAFGVGRVAFFSIAWFFLVARRSSGRLLTVLPLLMVAVMFFFLAAETWQSVGSLNGTQFFLATVLIALLAVGFLVARANSDLTELDRFSDLDELRAALPRPSLSAWLFAAPGTTPPRWQVPEQALEVRELSALERFNVRSIVVLGKFIASGLVALLVGSFFVLLGTIAVTPETATAWLGHAPSQVGSVSLFGHRYHLFAETLRVSVFLATFAGLYFVVSATTDKELARSLSEDTDQHLRTAFAVRAVARAEQQRRRG